ncbi:glycosyltransferase [Synechococcus sp. UW140]|uniref:glycosyltransferase n=1 Tax=Synechococcus sp. UW140 TaxID=368503 RepID=UPI0031383B5A
MSLCIKYKIGSLAVILTSYNHELYIEDSLEGILCQYRLPDQVIICDDASSDQTPEIIESFIRRFDLNWTFIRHNSNLGITLNLLSALKLVQSEYIIALAGDDISLPNRCRLSEKMFHENPDCSAILLSGHSINSVGQFIAPIMAPNEPISYFNFNIIKLGFPALPPVGLAYRAEVFTDFDLIAPLIKNEDDYLTVKALCFGGIANSHYISFYYRVHDNSASSWIRKSSSTEFHKKMHEDLINRIAHFSLWISLVSGSTMIAPELKFIFAEALSRKIKLYEHFYSRGSLDLVSDSSVFLQCFNILCFRDFIQLFFGLKVYMHLRNLKGAIISRFCTS